MTRPYTPETLANRWGVSATMVRNMCGAGDITHFRVGKLYRIPAKSVEDYECQKSASGGSGAGSASIGEMIPENDSAISLRHAPERRRKQKQ
ncbi:helix-turn-helix domain-containing protein [Sulfitobacter mediterraneus]|uniref:helix-turn-helix domain-containing protein n=1 Tax=Sulfitobacter mediterraneus TaxID=83219 RepID=UPI0009E07329